MDSFKLQYRILLDEEKIILFGKESLKSPIPTIKVLNLENYFEMFEAVHRGEEVIIPEFTDPKFEKIYMYVEIPAGSRYFEDGNRGAKATAQSIYTVPVAYSTFKINELFIPAIQKTISIFYNDTVPVNANAAYGAVNFNYSSLLDTIHSGMFLTVEKGRVVSIISYRNMTALNSAINTYNLRSTSGLFSVSTVETKQAYANARFFIPYELAETILEKELEIPKMLKEQTETYFSNLKMQVSNLKGFDWANQDLAICVSAGYLALNGFAFYKQTPYMLVGQAIGIGPLHVNNPSNLTGAIESIMKNQVIPGQTLNMQILSNLFAFSNACSRGYYITNSGSFLFINTDNLETTALSRACGVHEYVELNKEFFDSVKQIYVDNLDMVKDAVLAEKFRKAEFSVKRESKISEVDAINKRYIPLKNHDKKLLILTKTSLAKEAARKMAITRKITTAMMPVIDMAIRLFAIRDFELGFVDAKDAFPVQNWTIFSHATSISGHDWINLASSVTYKANFEAQLKTALIDLPAKSVKIATKAINQLYTDVIYEGTPFWEILNSYSCGNSGYRDNWAYQPQQKQEAKMLAFVLSAIFQFFDRNNYSSATHTDYFSPSSGQLDIYTLGNTLYKNSKRATFRPELPHLCSNSHNDFLSGKQLYHMFSNNFIGTDQTQSDEIERGKNSEYTVISNRNIIATSAFSFAQDALDSFVTLKKAKTFTEYTAWFVSVYPALNKIVTDVLEPTEPLIADGIKFFLANCNSVLVNLTDCEKPYLPKEETKKRGRKSKAVTTTAATTAAATTTESDEESDLSEDEVNDSIECSESDE